MSESSRTADRARLFWTLLPHLVFAVLFAVTFRRWILPFEDSGREMNTALRLAEGEALYRDVGYSYGPLSPIIDGFLLRTFGRNLDVLVAWRTVLALLGVEALRRLARRLAPGESLAAAVCSFAVAACAFGIGGSWTFPYSVAALTGTVGVWWALELALASESWAGSIAAGAVAGIAAATKLEFLPVALAGPILVLGLRRLTQGSHPGGCPGGGGGRDRVRRSGAGVRHRRHEAPGLSHRARRSRIVATRLRCGALWRDECAGFREWRIPRGALSLGARGRPRALPFSRRRRADSPSDSASIPDRRTHFFLVRKPLAALPSSARGLCGGRRARAGRGRVEAGKPVDFRRAGRSRDRHAPGAPPPALLPPKSRLRGFLGSTRARRRPCMAGAPRLGAARIHRPRPRPLCRPDRSARRGDRPRAFDVRETSGRLSLPFSFRGAFRRGVGPCHPRDGARGRDGGHLSRSLDSFSS